MYMGSRSNNSCKQETDPNIHFPNSSTGGFLHLPELESQSMNMNDVCPFKPPPNEPLQEPRSSCDWVTLDRLVASQLNGGGQNPKPFSNYGGDDEFSFSFESEDQLQQLMNMNESGRVNETDVWTFGRPSSSSSSDPLCHLSV